MIMWSNTHAIVKSLTTCVYFPLLKDDCCLTFNTCPPNHWQVSVHSLLTFAILPGTITDSTTINNSYLLLLGMIHNNYYKQFSDANRHWGAELAVDDGERPANDPHLRRQVATWQQRIVRRRALSIALQSLFWRHWERGCNRQGEVGSNNHS